jgi:hypothetical protein
MRFLSNQALGRNDNLDEHTRTRIGQSQFPTKLFSALSHPCQANAQTSGSHFRNLRTDSLAIVTDRHYHLIFLLTQRNPRLTCSRMPEDVGEGVAPDVAGSIPVSHPKNQSTYSRRIARPDQRRVDNAARWPFRNLSRDIFIVRMFPPTTACGVTLISL